ncbi:MAG: galactokinase [marine benthic group bacterium]|nr:galactokinase [Gemmatimonadota bacterium]
MPFEPDRFVRAPGRVNLIGEHVDYAGLPVFPMALAQAVNVAVRPRDDGLVHAASSNPGYGDREFRLAPSIDPYSDGDWGNYLKAAAVAAASRYGAYRGGDLFIGSEVPVAAGLSSSSALVNAVLLALLDLSDIEVDPIELATVAADAEQYVGTRGGGMDQAISMCAREGHAARIEFDPLRVTPVPIPSGWRFLVADTGVQAHKSGGARDMYNARRTAVEHAVSRVGEHLGYPQDERTYPLLLARHAPAELLDLAERVLDERHLRRFRHVVTEAERTRLAEQAMRSDAPEAFGELMNSSHDSLRGDFEVSGPELDRLVSLARGAGALGARLTGAGMGGCIVALCAPDRVDPVYKALREGYYAAAPGAPSTIDLEQRLFEAVPSAGATVRRVRPR